MSKGEIELKKVLRENRLLWIYCTDVQARKLLGEGLWDIKSKSVISVDLNKGAKEFLDTLLSKLGFFVEGVNLTVVDYEHLLLERWEHFRRAKEVDVEAEKKPNKIKYLSFINNIFLVLHLEYGYDLERVEETLSAIRFVSCFSEGLARIVVVDSVTEASNIRTSDFKEIASESYSFCNITSVGSPAIGSPANSFLARRKIPDSASGDVFESFTIDDSGRRIR